LYRRHLFAAGHLLIGKRREWADTQWDKPTTSLHEVVGFASVQQSIQNIGSVWGGIMANAATAAKQQQPSLSA
jgi:hypothetical protein